MSLARHRQTLQVAGTGVQEEIARRGGEEGDGEGKDVGGRGWVDIWGFEGGGDEEFGGSEGGC